MKHAVAFVILGFFLGFLGGGIFIDWVETSQDRDPYDFNLASKPAVISAGIDFKDRLIRVHDLRRALNPCIVSGPLPAGCEKYIKDGVLTQPPIKIILDPNPTVVSKQ